MAGKANKGEEAGGSGEAKLPAGSGMTTRSSARAAQAVEQVRVAPEGEQARRSPRGHATPSASASPARTGRNAPAPNAAAAGEKLKGETSHLPLKKRPFSTSGPPAAKAADLVNAEQRDQTPRRSPRGHATPSASASAVRTGRNTPAPNSAAAGEKRKGEASHLPLKKRPLSAIGPPAAKAADRVNAEEAGPVAKRRRLSGEASKGKETAGSGEAKLPAGSGRTTRRTVCAAQAGEQESAAPAYKTARRSPRGHATPSASTSAARTGRNALAPNAAAAGEKRKGEKSYLPPKKPLVSTIGVDEAKAADCLNKQREREQPPPRVMERGGLAVAAGAAAAAASTRMPAAPIAGLDSASSSNRGGRADVEQCEDCFGPWVHTFNLCLRCYTGRRDCRDCQTRRASDSSSREDRAGVGTCEDCPGRASRAAYLCRYCYRSARLCGTCRNRRIND